MKPPIKFVYFDVGGVILEWHGLIEIIAKRYNKSVDKVWKAFGIYDPHSNLGKITPQELWLGMCRELKIPNGEIVDFSSLAMQTFSPILETHEFVRNLSQHLPVGILSNIHFGFYKHCLQHGHIPNIKFSAVVESCEIGLVKPEKEIFLHAQRLVKVQPENILFIDDYEENIRGAKAAGWQAILFETQNPAKSLQRIKNILSL
jgi:FMN phosphatase YigB (HAD superfamily)